ncbi:MAG: LapA family protein [Thermodesulfobacteriota bacterium]|nr:LapA family protein [Thermodesulfobacteriota bacterium]
MTPKRIVFLAIALLFTVFVFQNAEVVEVQFLFWKTEASRALILAGSFLLGLAVGWLTRWLLRKERKAKQKPAEQ